MSAEELRRVIAWAGDKIAKLFLGVVVVVALIGISPLGRDDSDPGFWGTRSNVAVRIDHKTGCEYLEGRNGGLTPRLDVDGGQMGCKR